MLVNTMSDQEILNEIRRDYNSCREKINYYHDKFKRALRKKSSCIDYYKLISPNGNEWNTFYISRGFEMFYKHYVFLRNNDGSYKVLSVNLDKTGVIGVTIFSSHFFQRYQERYYKNEKYSFRELFLKFLTRNNYFLSIDTDDGGYTIMSDGIGLTYLGEIETVCYVNTFITKDMLKPNQLKKLDILLELYK